MKISKEIKSKLNILVLILVTIIVLYISLKDNFFEVINGLTKLNIFWIIIALIFIMGYYFLRALSLHTFVTKFKDIPFKKIFKIVFVTQFFDGITPSSSCVTPKSTAFIKTVDVVPSLLTTLSVPVATYLPEFLIFHLLSF